MGGNDTPITCRTELRTGEVTLAGRSASEYDGYCDERLCECPRRNGRLLREYGADERTIRTLCVVEEHLRARNIDPDNIIKELNV